MKKYQIFLKILNETKLPNHLYPRLIIGNHDNRENFKKKRRTNIIKYQRSQVPGALWEIKKKR